ncbi:porin [Roseomonas sp. E05]|uniref:OprO/OprP family phosphate-selective porin n=1 Tax=Roseomonas sp. E05 TaxID=3046310 RepID=UPI0024BB3FF8|nr:porin [Roseomonas sp. E05]MDJ0388256.1 porin [Roseomonas sp. E05]
MRPVTAPLLLLALALPCAAQAQAGLEWSEEGVPELRLARGAVQVTPVLRLDLDAGAYDDQERAGGFRSGVNVRRARLGLEATLPNDFEASFIWDFGASSVRDASDLYEAALAWKGLGWGTIRAGAYKPQHMLEQAGSSFDLLFIERAVISDLAADIASGTGRQAAGLEVHRDRWSAAGYVTAGEMSKPQSWGQRGMAGRVTAIPLRGEGLLVQLGANAAYQWRPGQEGGYNEASLSGYPELRVDTRQFLDTGSIEADSLWAVGPELAGAAGRFYGQAEYQYIGIDTPQGGMRHGEGWYVAASYTLLGAPRSYDRETSTWKRPKPLEAFNPATGQWGALEVAGRYSVADLRDGPVQGGAQRIWTAGLNWYPHPMVKVMLNYQDGHLALAEGGRDFKAIGLRLSYSL